MPRNIIYMLNSLSGGGAENGLVMLLQKGMFQGHNVWVLAMIEGDGKVSQSLQTLLPQGHLKVLSKSKNMGIVHMLAAMVYYPWLALTKRATVSILSLEQANIVGRFWAHLMPWLKTYSFEHNVIYAKPIYGKILKALSWPVQGILCDSQRTCDAVRTKWFLRPQALQVAVVPLVCVGDTQPRPNYEVHHPLRLVCTGRLTTQKNQQAILHAMQALKSKGIATTLALYGEGDDKEALTNLARNLGLEKEVSFKGYKPEWKAELDDYDIYLQPSLYEGLCITLLEAMSTGIPCIASAVGEIPSYGKDGHNIRLLQKPDKDALSVAVESLMQTAIRKKIGSEAVKTVQAHYGEIAVKVAFNNALNVVNI